MHPKIKACIDSCTNYKQLATCIAFAMMSNKKPKLYREIMNYIDYKQRLLDVSRGEFSP